MSLHLHDHPNKCWGPTFAPIYFASAVSGNGTVFVAGGEYNAGQDTNSDILVVEIYDQVMDSQMQHGNRQLSIVQTLWDRVAHIPLQEHSSTDVRKPVVTVMMPGMATNYPIVRLTNTATRAGYFCAPLIIPLCQLHMEHSHEY